VLTLPVRLEIEDWTPFDAALKAAFEKGAPACE